MGWGSFAEKLDRVLGGYKSEKEERKEVPGEALPETRVEPTIFPPKHDGHTFPKNNKVSGGPRKLAPSASDPIYDAPAITKDTVPIVNAALPTVKPKKARKSKQKIHEEKQIAAVAT